MRLVGMEDFGVLQPQVILKLTYFVFTQEIRWFIVEIISEMEAEVLDVSRIDRLMIMVRTNVFYSK